MLVDFTVPCPLNLKRLRNAQTVKNKFLLSFKII